MVFETSMAMASVVAASAFAFSKPSRLKARLGSAARGRTESERLRWLADVEDLVAKARADEDHLEHLEKLLEETNWRIETRSRQLTEVEDELDAGQRVWQYLAFGALAESPFSSLCEVLHNAERSLRDLPCAVSAPLVDLLGPAFEVLPDVESYVVDLEATVADAFSGPLAGTESRNSISSVASRRMSRGMCRESVVGAELFAGGPQATGSAGMVPIVEHGADARPSNRDQGIQVPDSSDTVEDIAHKPSPQPGVRVKTPEASEAAVPDEHPEKDVPVSCQELPSPRQGAVLRNAASVPSVPLSSLRAQERDTDRRQEGGVEEGTLRKRSQDQHSSPSRRSRLGSLDLKFDSSSTRTPRLPAESPVLEPTARGSWVVIAPGKWRMGSPRDIVTPRGDARGTAQDAAKSQVEKVVEARKDTDVKNGSAVPQISDRPSSDRRVPVLRLLKSTSNFSVEEGSQLQPLPGVCAGDQSPPATDSLSDPPVVGTENLTAKVNVLQDPAENTKCTVFSMDDGEEPSLLSLQNFLDESSADEDDEDEFGELLVSSSRDLQYEYADSLSIERDALEEQLLLQSETFERERETWEQKVSKMENEYLALRQDLAEQAERFEREASERLDERAELMHHVLTLASDLCVQENCQTSTSEAEFSPLKKSIHYRMCSPPSSPVPMVKRAWKT
uniref:Uncharacterized protein n=1 Tax=Noctiluca scintillans TaxID=2966 RepID=A0A7S1FFA4_NOCSC|mmetsp:Transcript_59644/g.158708  ORF Transcript_59644/g.158708 Transcript_59644/m.158708 type:complete len:677 (+) Transcript_59644:80-2110(+)